MAELKLNECIKEVHQDAIEKGWYENPKDILGHTMMIVTELSELIEADRGNLYHSEYIKETCKGDIKGATVDFDDVSIPLHSERKFFEETQKDTMEDEIADTFIRLMDLCAFLGIEDIEYYIKSKMAYNKGRSHRHGNKKY